MHCTLIDSCTVSLTDERDTSQRKAAIKSFTYVCANGLGTIAARLQILPQFHVELQLTVLLNPISHGNHYISQLHPD